jgi:pantoate--beta-alanine ligase
MELLRTPADLDAFYPTAPGAPREAAFVPTMGALHAGHAALVRQAAATGEPTIVSVFVNPTQFNDPADFARYPKTLDEDLEISRAAGAAAVWAPSVEDIYPDGPAAGVPPLPEVATRPGLEDAARPGHFAGVCQVVLRLFRVVRPRIAVFGEKDWQQLQVVSAMAEAYRAREWMPTILPGPTVRDPDGLALSSRNRFLSPQDRAQGLAIIRALRAAALVDDPRAAEARMREVLAAAGITPDYAVVRDAETLLDPRPGRPVRRLIAARVGPVRLIDNL